MSQENLNQHHNIHHQHQQPIVIHHNGSFSPSINPNEQGNHLMLNSTKQDEPQQHASQLPQGVSIVNVANKVEVAMGAAASVNSPTLSESVSTNTNLNNKVNVPESGDETEEENEEVEQSPGGRLVMDTENGYGIVWNEINISSGRKFKNNRNINNDEVKFLFFEIHRLSFKKCAVH